MLHKHHLVKPAYKCLGCAYVPHSKNKENEAYFFTAVNYGIWFQNQVSLRAPPSPIGPHWQQLERTTGLPPPVVLRVTLQKSCKLENLV